MLRMFSGLTAFSKIPYILSSPDLCKDERQKARMNKHKLRQRARKPIYCLGVHMYALMSVFPNTVICHMYSILVQIQILNYSSIVS